MATICDTIIFKPLGMTHTLANDYDRIVPHRAQGYVYGEDALAQQAFLRHQQHLQRGDSLSTVRDLLTWSSGAAQRPGAERRLA